MKIGVVIQGPLKNSDTLERSLSCVQEFISPEDIVISSWLGEDLQSKVNVEIIRSDPALLNVNENYFDILNQNNRFYQVYSTAVGIAHLLRKKDYDYLIKLRTDEYYCDYTELINRMTSDPRIHSGNMFFRKDFPFHVGDHLMACPAEEIKQFFEASVTKFIELTNPETFFAEFKGDKYQKTIFPANSALSSIFSWDLTVLPVETVLTLFYLWSKGHDVQLSDQVELMNKYFCPFPIQKFKKFQATANVIFLQFTEETIEGLRDSILGPMYECKSCPPDIICSQRQHQALVCCLIDSFTLDSSEIVSLPNGADNYNSLRCPWRVVDEFKWRIKL